MTAREAVELRCLVRPCTAFPVHYEGWTHFRQGRGPSNRNSSRRQRDIGRRLQWLPIYVRVSIAG
jgi:hypothetical protein